MKILVDENIPYVDALFSRFGEVQAVAGRSISTSALVNVDALIVRSVTRVDSSLLNGTRVAFVGTATAGIDHIDETWLAQSGISFSSAPGCNAIAVVEYVFSALLWLAYRDNFTLRDKTVGIIGVGHVGSCLQRRLNAFGVHTLLCDPPLAESGVSGDWQTLDQIVAEADILTFHTPLICTGRHATWHLVDKTILGALPAGRIIINTCRGAVVDNNALLDMLEQGKSLSVVLDVWESEPSLSLPLLAYVDIGTAHIAGYTLEGKARGTTQIFDAYSTFMGSNARANLVSLLPSPSGERIRLHGVIDENALRLLTHLVYDVRRDDIRLRRSANLPGGFDLLRKNYYQRREWSSLCVETDDMVTAGILRQLGFRAQPAIS